MVKASVKVYPISGVGSVEVISMESVTVVFDDGKEWVIDPSLAPFLRHLSRQLDEISGKRKQYVPGAQDRDDAKRN